MEQRFLAFQDQLDRRIAAEQHAIDTSERAQNRASDQAEREREKASLVLRDEQRHATDIAEREREKAAQTLATALTQSIREGDDRLREHIENQVQQINSALVAARRETTIINSASKEAISKAEVSTDKRFAASNEVRSQMADQLTAHRENLEKIVRELMPREVAEARLDELRQQIQGISEKLGKLV